jgi:hypothetical protein
MRDSIISIRAFSRDRERADMLSLGKKTECDALTPHLTE